jgi:signal transduction histidine kinase
VLQKIEDQLTKAHQLMRTLATDLHPPVLNTGRIDAAIQWLNGDMKEKFGMTVRADVDEAVEPTTEIVRNFIFQAVRELLLNVLKHAGVKSAQVRLKQEDENWILVEVEDNGAGFDTEQTENNNRFGLFSIRERVDYLCGQMTIQSTPGTGTRITMKLPRN